MPRYAWCADLGGTKIAVARVSATGTISHRQEAPTPQEGGKAVVDALIALLQRLPAIGVCAIGVDVPGLARPDGTVWAPNLPGWTKWPLRRQLARHFGRPVVVESDRNAFVVGEAWKGAAQGSQDAVYLIVGTGIGAGILSGGRLLRGHQELAGAVGWMATREVYQPEFAGVGCLESFLAGPGLAREASRHLGRPLDTRELVRLGRAGDPLARQLWEEAGRRLGIALANLTDILNPEVIVVGGGVSRAGSLLLAPARRALRQWGQPLAARHVRVVGSRLGADAGLLGIARLAFDSHKTSADAGAARQDKTA